MEKKQKTLKKEISLQGRGLHTGNITKLTFKPAPINYGRRFVSKFCYVSGM
ncbi:MAG: UDP-3-O-acyl-N-acetylglucosamine deacetylase [Calditrichaceae bacterium]